MRCIVTAGPTWEPLDGARRLTNFSTGSLGGTLANHLAFRGHDVLLLLGEGAVWRSPIAAIQVRSFSTTASLASELESNATSERLAVFHAAAVSDFKVVGTSIRMESGGLKPIESGKFSTRSGNLWVELTPTPKVISRLREWFPFGFLIGWKYEVDGGLEGVAAAGREQMTRTRVDHCVLNGPAYGAGFGVLNHDGSIQHLIGRPELLELLSNRVASREGTPTVGLPH